jgi:hypothetical protein
MLSRRCVPVVAAHDANPPWWSADCGYHHDVYRNLLRQRGMAWRAQVTVRDL